MTFLNYTIVSKWGADGLTPPEIGARLSRMLHELSPLAPAMRNWDLLDGSANWRAVPLREAEPNMTAFVERNVHQADFGGPDPQSGYLLLAWGSDIPTDEGKPDTVHIAMTAGSSLGWQNDLEFEIGSPQLPKDYSLITYPIYKGALEAIASVWPCPWALANFYVEGLPMFQRVLDRGGDREGWNVFNVPWIAYLSAPLAAGLEAPPPILSEPTSGGGVILSAVEDRIDYSNPDHLRRARLLEAILIDRVGVSDWPHSHPGDHPARAGPF